MFNLIKHQQQQQQLDDDLQAKCSYMRFKDQVQSLRILACKELRDHYTVKDENNNFAATTTTTQTSDENRLERLLMRLNQLKKINSNIMEELFFNDVVGNNVKIDRLIPSIIGSSICAPSKSSTTSTNNSSSTFSSSSSSSSSTQQETMAPQNDSSTF